MATTALWAIKTNLNQVIDYVKNKEKTYQFKDLRDVIDYAKNEDKTEKMYYVSGINCSPDHAYEEMKLTKRNFNKQKGIIAFHGYQSFKGNEVTPEEAHSIGIELASEMWGDKYEVLVTTHLNTQNIHNHFVINSVSFVDGEKYRNTKSNYAELRHLNDEICLKHNLSVLKENDYYKGFLPTNMNYYSQTKKDLDLAIKKARSYNEFTNIMKSLDYIITVRADKLSVRNINYKRNIRIERYYGERYSIDNIKKRIEIENMNSYPYLEEIKSNKFIHIKEKKQYHGLRGLYRYYCFLLKIYPTNIKKYHLSYETRKEIAKLDEISKEAIFLDKYKLDSEEDFNNFKNNKSKELEDLKYKRRSLKRRNKDNSLTNDIDNITMRINELKDILKTCDSIENRTPKIEEKINEITKLNEINRSI